MKILITGATGYVGHNLAMTLALQGNDVNILVRNPQSANVPVHPNIHVFCGDITEKNTIGFAMHGCETVFHTAALVCLWAKDPSDFFTINVEGTRNMLDVALQSGVKKFVFTSTCGVIGPSVKEPMCEKDPRISGFDNDYDLSKFLAETLVTEYNSNRLLTVIVSPSKVYGPGIETHPLSINRIIRNFILGKNSFCPSPANFISNYVFIDDLVRGHILAMEKGIGGEKYILGGENLSYSEFFQAIHNVSGIRGKLLLVPKIAAKIFAWCYFVYSRLRHKTPFFTSKGINVIYCNKSFTCSKAIHQLGYTITPFAQALLPTIHFLKQQNYV